MYKTYTNWEGKEFIIRNEVEWIPTDLKSSDYKNYLQWLEEGNVPGEWDNGN
jgi:hypothetical protein